VKFRKPSTATAIATTALVIAVGGGTAFAASQLAPGSVGNAQLQNNAVTNPKIKQGTIEADRLSAQARAALKGNQGPAGQRGPQGPAGKDGTPYTPVTTLTGTWVDHSDGTDGHSSINAGGAQLGGTGTNGGLADKNDYAGIATHVLDGKTPADLATISYTESYAMASDSHFAAPYFKLKLQPSGGACGADDVVYNPAVQSTNLDYAGETETFKVTDTTSTVGVNNDANPVDGMYPVAIHSANNGAGKDVSNETICLAEIILGGGSDATNATATINDVTFAGAGVPSRTYQFGS
jgi:hypothetical protein